MYLRVTKRRNADGTEVRYYQLAENTWDAKRGCAVAKVIYSFGRSDQLDGEKLKRLAKSILRVVGDDTTVSPPRETSPSVTRGSTAPSGRWSSCGRSSTSR